MRYVKRYMESIGLQSIIILKTDENCIIRIEDNLTNISKFKKLRQFLELYNLSFSWRNLETKSSFFIPQIEIIIGRE